MTPDDLPPLPAGIDADAAEALARWLLAAADRMRTGAQPGAPVPPDWLSTGQLRAAGLSETTIRRRAAELGVKARDGTWRLPPVAAQKRQPGRRPRRRNMAG